MYRRADQHRSPVCTGPSGATPSHPRYLDAAAAFIRMFSCQERNAPRNPLLPRLRRFLAEALLQLANPSITTASGSLLPGGVVAYGKLALKALTDQPLRDVRQTNRAVASAWGTTSALRSPTS